MNSRYADWRFMLALTMALLAGSALSLLAHPPDVGTVETVALFNAAALEAPESIAILPDGTQYISLARTGLCQDREERARCSARYTGPCQSPQDLRSLTEI